MEPIKFTLCPRCTECPEVEITDQGVRIGEDANTVRLTHAEWNELVALTKRGELHEVKEQIGRGSFGGPRFIGGDGRCVETT